MGNEMGNNNTSSLKEAEEERVRVNAPNGSLHETVKENDVKGDHLIAEDDSKESDEKAEDLAFHCAIAGDNHVDQLITSEENPQVLSQVTHEVNEGDRHVEDQPRLSPVNLEDTEPSMESDVGECEKSDSQLNIEAADIEDPQVLSRATDEVNEGDRHVEDQPELSSVNLDDTDPSVESDVGKHDKSDSQLNIEAANIEDPQLLSQATYEVNEGDRYVEDRPEVLLLNSEDTEPSMESDVGKRDKSDSQLNIEAASIEVENGETNSSLTVLGDLETQTSEGVKTDPLGLDKVDVSMLVSDACGLEVSREDFLGSPSTFPAGGNTSVSDACGSEVSGEDFVGSPSTFLAEGNDPTQGIEIPSGMNVTFLSNADFECTHLKLEQEQVEGDKASNVEVVMMNNENRSEDRTESNFLNFGHEEKLNEATTVSGSTLQSEDSVADHSPYSHPEVSELEDQSSLVMEEIEFTSSTPVNENNIKCDDGFGGHSDELWNIQPEQAEAKDVSEMVVGLETITDDVGNTVEVPLDCPSAEECKVKVTDVAENGFQDEICAKASKDFHEYMEGEDCSMPISVEPEAGDTNRDENDPAEKEMIEDKRVETELSQAIVDDTSRKDIMKQFIPVHSPHIRESLSSFDYPVMIAHPVSETKASGDQCNSKSQQCQMPLTPGGNTKLEKISGSLSTELKSYNDTNIHPQLQKFPSFDFDLLNGSRNEESDQTPLLFPDRSTFRSMSMKGRCDRAEQRECLEEKTVWIDRSDSERSKTPFLGLSKKEQEDDEKQEAYLVATPQKQVVIEADTKASKAMWVVPTEEVGSTSPKGKEKRKFRSSLFGNCMCCATVIN
ncbi:uncharacterized protein LOC104414748 [Eucalyptus grandis]|nr:uncharacterized protein LOC104414748 [Eucalyptus grandis]